MREPIDYFEVGAGTPMVLIHGDFNDGRTAWSRQIESLPKHHRLIVVNRRGHTGSPKEPMPYTIHGDALDVLEAATLADADRFHLTGHSYGGLVAIEMARLAPERILSLHLIEPPYLALLPADEPSRTMDERGRAVKGEMAKLTDEQITEEFFRMIAGEEGMQKIRATASWPLLVQEARRFVNGEDPGDYPPEAVHELRLTVPVVVYTGGRSDPGLQAIARRIADVIPGARFIEVPEGFHGVQRTGDPFDRELLAITANL